MKIGLFAINYGTCGDPAFAVQVAQAAEAHGFERDSRQKTSGLSNRKENNLPGARIRCRAFLFSGMMVGRRLLAAIKSWHETLHLSRKPVMREAIYLQPRRSSPMPRRSRSHGEFLD